MPAYQEWISPELHFKSAGQSIWPQGHFLSREWFRQAVVDFTLWFFFQGSGLLIDEDGNEYPLVPGVCLCMRPGMTFEARQREGELLGNAYFHLIPQRGNQLLPCEEWPWVPFYSQVPNMSFFDQSIRRMLHLLYRKHIPGYREDRGEELQAELLMKALLIELVRNATESNGGTNDMGRHHDYVFASMISALYTDPQHFHTVGDLAKRSGYSISHFRNLCLKITGKSPSELLVDARVEKAKKYLKYSQLSIGTIAESLGYANVYHFSRQFRKAIGITAKEYRNHYMDRH